VPVVDMELIFDGVDKLGCKFCVFSCFRLYVASNSQLSRQCSSSTCLGFGFTAICCVTDTSGTLLTEKLNEPAPPSDQIAPTLLEKPKIIPNADASRVTMEVKCKAKPAPKAVWTKGGTVIREGAKYSSSSSQQGGVIGEDVYIYRMEVTNPGAAEGGTYKCTIKNEAGEANANLNLNIDGNYFDAHTLHVYDVQDRWLRSCAALMP